MSTRYLYTALLTFLSIAVTAQTKSDYLSAADRFFKDGDYYSASQYYEQYLADKPDSLKRGYNPYVIQKVSKKITVDKPSGRRDVVYNLAESYRKTNNFLKAEPYYLEAAQWGNEYPLAPYWHAKCERALGNLELAEVEFKAFLASYSLGDEYTKDVQKELDNLQFIKLQAARTDLGRFDVARSGDLINKAGASYAPFFLSDGTLTFTSTRPDANVTVAAGKNIYTNRIYTTGAGNSFSSEVEKILIPADNKMEQGVASFTPDANKIFFTRWVTQNDNKRASLYSSIKKDNVWSSPVKLPVNINADGASTQQPFITADGKYLLFSSDRSGGFGKYDIWYIALDENFEPSGEAMNMGNAINTADDDEAPFYHQQSNILVVASKGRTGMGGFDLYYSKGQFGNWQTPVNMGQPVNSTKDDIYYATSDKTSIWNSAFLSSDRNSECCLELFSFDRKSLPRLITGTVVDCVKGTVLPNATVTIKSSAGNVIATRTTNAEGKYSLSIPEYQPLNIYASTGGYNTNSISVSFPDAELDSTVNPAICLAAIPEKAIKENTIVVLKNVMFGFNDYRLNNTSVEALDTLAGLMKEHMAMEIEISSHTDNIGSDEYNQALSERRAKACVDYLAERGIDASRIQVKAYGASKPVAENTINGKDNPEGRAKNRRTEFKILHY